MPLVALAYVAVAAGLLIGSGGLLFFGGAVAMGFVAAGAWRRSVVLVSLAALHAVGAAVGWIARQSDERCAAQIAREGRATVRLREPVAPGVSARAFATGRGCRVAVRLRVISDSASTGATVAVRGLVSQEGARVSFSEARIRRLRPPGILARARTRAGHTIDALFGDRAPLARALVIADEGDIAPEVRRQFADAGIIHMLSVSGLHVAVLAEAIVLALLMAGASTRRAEVAATVLVAVFVVFVGAPSPAVRSAAMFAALVAAKRLQRPTSPWALLALGAAVPLVEPRVANEIGYHLSVVGMAALIASGRLTRRVVPATLPSWGARVLRETIATVVASAVTAPIVAWHFGRVSLAAPLTNLAAAPLFGLAQPALFLTLLVAPIRPVASLLADGTRVLLAGIERVGAWGAAIPWSAIDAQPSVASAMALAVASIALLFACAARYWATPASVVIAALGFSLWWPVVRPWSSRLEVHMIDVGQGDAIALRTPRWRWILIDAGDTWRDTDVGERVVAPYLRRRGGEIALFVVSHPHADHIGGARSVLERVPVAAIYDGAYPQPSSVYAQLLEAAATRHVRWHTARTGDAIVVDGVTLTVLAPDSADIANAHDANAASVVLMAEYRGARVLLTGDAEREVEAALVQRLGDRLGADVLKAGHHGSATSSTGPFLDAVSPRVALVSVGAGNRYGHPSEDVVRALQQHGAQVLRSDDGGSVVVSLDGSERMVVSTEDARWVLRRSRTRRAPTGPG